MMQFQENILALIEKYFAGTITPDEKDYLNDWYHSFNDDEVELTLDDSEDEQQLFERIRSRLLDTLHEDQIEEVKKRDRKWLLPVAAAIAILILLSAGYLTFLSKPSKTEIAKELSTEKKPDNDIAPGGNKAILTLADGSVIILDSVSNGMISRQGNIKVEKLDNGLLAYTKNGDQVITNNEAFFNIISTPRGGQYKVTLADGTRVWLNAASSIRFPVAFRGKERKVEITGEAYFEVAKDPAKPFRVFTSSSSEKSDGAEIEVLGTHFNVNAYNDENSIKATLLEGKIKVSTPASYGRGSYKSLLPGEQAEISSDGKIEIDGHADTEEAVAWVNGYFQFKSADLKTILRQITRWYDVEIEYKENVDTHFTGQLTRNENVSKVLNELMLTGEVHFKIDGKKIIVSH